MNPNFILSENAILLLEEAAKVAFPHKKVTFTQTTLNGYIAYLFMFEEKGMDAITLSWVELAAGYLQSIAEGGKPKENIDEEQIIELCDSFHKSLELKDKLKKYKR